jgi:hypothetical protein
VIHRNLYSSASTSRGASATTSATTRNTLCFVLSDLSRIHHYAWATVTRRQDLDTTAALVTSQDGNFGEAMSPGAFPPPHLRDDCHNRSQPAVANASTGKNSSRFMQQSAAATSSRKQKLRYSHAAPLETWRRRLSSTPIRTNFEFTKFWRSCLECTPARTSMERSVM